MGPKRRVRASGSRGADEAAAAADCSGTRRALGPTVLLAVLLIVGGTLGCSSTRPVAEADRSMSLEHPPSEVLATTRAMLESRGYEIAAFRPDSGLVRTRYRRDDDLLGPGKEARMQVTGRVEERADGSRIVLGFTGQMRMGGDETWSRMPFGSNDRTIYQNYLSQIRQMLP